MALKAIYLHFASWSILGLGRERTEGRLPAHYLRTSWWGVPPPLSQPLVVRAPYGKGGGSPPFNVPVVQGGGGTLSTQVSVPDAPPPVGITQHWLQGLLLGKEFNHGWYVVCGM